MAAHHRKRGSKNGQAAKPANGVAAPASVAGLGVVRERGVAVPPPPEPSTAADGGATGFAEVLADERVEIAERMPRPFSTPVATRRNLTGLCFSGGGIRSACFNLGMLEGLDRLRFTAPAVDGEANLRLYRTMHKAIQTGLLRSAHDCSEGGLLVALAESCIGGMVGMTAEIDSWSDCLKEFGGSISAEHGIGIMKVASQPRYKSHAELDAMRALKRTFDPNNILNPGKTVPPVLRL